jgi:hypothetical protein
MQTHLLPRILAPVASVLACLLAPTPLQAHPGDWDARVMPGPPPGPAPATSNQGSRAPSAAPDERPITAPNLPSPSPPTPPLTPDKPDRLRPNLPLIEEHLGYRSLVNIRVAQAAHGHWAGHPDWAPLEIWYVATRKQLDDKQVIFCVRPRLEIPAPGVTAGMPREWSTPVWVQLYADQPNAKLLAEAISSAPLRVGTSVELVASNNWCAVQALGTSAPRWKIQTSHGGTRVVFP